MSNQSIRKKRILIILTVLSGGFLLYYLDRYFFYLVLGTTEHLEYVLSDHVSFFRFMVGYGMIAWHRILRLVFAFVAGFLFYSILERKKSFLLAIWICWQIWIYAFHIITFEKPLWLVQDPLNFAWRMLTILPFFLGAKLRRRFPVLDKELTSDIAKYIVVGLGIIMIILSGYFYARVMTSDGYRAAQEFKIDIPLNAVSVHRSWRPFRGIRTITFKIEMENPDSLVHYYDQKLNWEIMPSFTHDEERGWQVAPGEEWEWIDVPSEWETFKEVRGFGMITWIDYEDDMYLGLIIRAKQEDPQNLFEVTVNCGPVFLSELMRRIDTQ